MKPKILITNDDGIEAAGIKHLSHAICEFGDLLTVAPATNKSGVGLGVSLHATLHIKQVSNAAWSVTGTPADCVKMALSVILENPPDLIVSGINRGHNAGRNVLYSGTIGGVIEGILRGIPGIAFSSYDFADEPDYALYEPWAAEICKFVLQHPLPAGTILNVNFPSSRAHLRKDGNTEPHGVKLTRQGKQYAMEDLRLLQSYESQAHSYFVDARLVTFEEEPDSDIYWLERGYITCVPIHVDELTDWRYIKSHREHFEASLNCNKSLL